MGSERTPTLLALCALILLGAACSGPAESADSSTTTASERPTSSGEVVAGNGASATEAGSSTSTSTVERTEPAAPPGLYVSPAGDDSASGESPADAFATIAHAVKQLAPGDTLWVLDGEFVEQERSDSGIVVNRSGTAQDWIRIAAFPGANPVIRTDHKNGLKIEGASYVEVRGLTFAGSIDTARLEANPTAYSGAGINVDAIYSGGVRNHHVRIIGNTISGYGAGGIPVTGTSHVEIRDNVIYDVASIDPSQHSGISILEPFNMGFDDDADGYSNYITGNTVYGVENTVRDRNGLITDGNCIILDRTNQNGYTGRTLVANNFCVDNGGRGVQVYQSARVDVVNNTLFGNSQTDEVAARGGDLGAYESQDVTFANNLVFTVGGHHPARSFQSSDVRFENNLFVASRGADYNGAAADGDLVITDFEMPVVVDPTDVARPDLFELVAESAAVDAGTARFQYVV
ncbi:MAG: right-handed parallel beta-helix repeat-containing protein, partial [Acidimicrobiales bacterium]|nr:right-handed parallel beta-helix repeat-containing protein [Acidimicrobiales bacterium]